MIHTIDFMIDWRCFKIGDRIEFRPGVNLLVGDQGCGKSSLIRAIYTVGASKKDFGQDKKLRDGIRFEATPCKFYKFDFEKDNPRTLSYFGDNIQSQLASMWRSHGECTRALLNCLDVAAECLLLVDEPDTALSIRSCNQLVRVFKGLEGRGGQIIASVHNPTVIQQFETVYSLEHRKWMTSTEFIETQSDPAEFIPIKPQSK